MSPEATSDDNKATITKQALLKRINRKLAKKGQALRTYRGCPDGIAPFYQFDTRRNITLAEHVDLETFGRELGVLASHEVIVKRWLATPMATDAARDRWRGATRPFNQRHFKLRIFPPTGHEDPDTCRR